MPRLWLRPSKKSGKAISQEGEESNGSDQAWRLVSASLANAMCVRKTQRTPK